MRGNAPGNDLTRVMFKLNGAMDRLRGSVTPNYARAINSSFSIVKTIVEGSLNTEMRSDVLRIAEDLTRGEDKEVLKRLLILNALNLDSLTQMMDATDNYRDFFNMRDIPAFMSCINDAIDIETSVSLHPRLPVLYDNALLRSLPLLESVNSIERSGVLSLRSGTQLPGADRLLSSPQLILKKKGDSPVYVSDFGSSAINDWNVFVDTERAAYSMNVLRDPELRVPFLGESILRNLQLVQLKKSDHYFNISQDAFYSNDYAQQELLLENMAEANSRLLGTRYLMGFSQGMGARTLVFNGLAPVAEALRPVLSMSGLPETLYGEIALLQKEYEMQRSNYLRLFPSEPKERLNALFPKLTDR